MPREQAQLVEHKRISGDLDQWLGRIGDARAEPCSETSCEDANSG
jgi:hypothetical protein